MTLLAELVEASQRVGATGSRLAKAAEIAAFLRKLAPEEIQVAVNFLSGTLRQGRIGIGFANLTAAMPAAPPPSPSLTIGDVDSVIEDFIKLRGAGSASARNVLLKGLLARTTAGEQEFLVPLFAGELRQGALAGVMIEAIAAAAALPVQQVRQAAMYSSDLGSIARDALVEGAATLAALSLQVFSPVSPMLAQTAADVAEALREMRRGPRSNGRWMARASRLHKWGARGADLYARPERCDRARCPKSSSECARFAPETLVLDGEAIAFDAAGRPHPFQVTMRRFGRKLDVEPRAQHLPIQAFFFDCLRLDEHSTSPTVADRERSRRWHRPCRRRCGFRSCHRLRARSAGFYDAALAAGHEGVMAKSLDAPYEAGSRGASWLKIKRAHTLDLVVLAAEWGHGRRTGKLSNLHLGALDPATGEYIMLGKTFKGLTDAMLEWQTRELLARDSGATHGPCTCGRSSWWRSPSAICRPARAIRAVSRCAWRA